MRIALDTNVVIRFLTFDDEEQGLAARRVIQEADEIVLPTVVLCEAAWALRSGYRYGRTELARALRLLVDMQGIIVDRPVVEAGLRILGDGGDFADGCILFEAKRAKCDRVATFDKTFAALTDGFASPP
jgi:predicted nucleic-acid-binding protein